MLGTPRVSRASGRPFAAAALALATACLSARAGAQAAAAPVPEPAGDAASGEPAEATSPRPTPVDATASLAPNAAAPDVAPMMRGGDDPPPSSAAYFQYGVAFTAEIPSFSGPICDNVEVPCILGAGGGVAVRAGYRGGGHIYLGAAYEVSKQDPNNLYRLALLQQARVEGRYYVGTAREAYPYATAGVGVAGYGNEWSVDTWGPGGSLGVGVEAQITRRTLVGVALSYRVAYLSGFVDTSGATRAAGVTQLFGLDLVLEQRDPLGGAADEERPRRPAEPR